MDQIKVEILEIYRHLNHFLKNPIQEIKKLPDWEWRRLLTAQILVTAVCGALGGFINLSVTSVLFGLIFMPAITIVMAFVSSLFFYYFFQIFTEKTILFRQLYTVVFFANIPFFIFQIVSGYFPPMSLIGLAATAFFLIVGLVENFSLPRRMVGSLLAALYFLFVLIWIWGRIDASKIERTWRSEMNAPEVKLGE